jgi:NitT/TauT family transport system ATP-binding protein
MQPKTGTQAMTSHAARIGNAEVSSASASDVPFVEAKGVSVGFATGTWLRPQYQTVLCNIDLVIRKGRFVTLLGPSGCGKSTLLKTLGGLLPPGAGCVTINGQPVQHALADRQIGLVFQDAALLPWKSALANAAFLCGLVREKWTSDAARTRGREMLALVGLADSEAKYPHQLSGGMRQRVSICRALLHEPELLLMDEPFGALDALTRERMSADLLEIHQSSGVSVLFITHSIPEAVLLSDRVVVMTSRPGRIAEIIDIDLPRPRTPALESTPEFAGHVAHVRELFVREGVLAR